MTVSERIQRRFGKASVEFRLIEDGDKILVGLSGGKFSVEAAHIRMENIHYETDASYLQSFCDKLGVPLHVITTRLSPPTTQAKKKPMCFLCSWQRRKQLFNLAQELGCNKIALGHHQDDIIHTALMNLTFEGQFSAMPALLRMKKMPLTIIRPLCLCEEADIRIFAEQQNYRKLLKQCPYEHETSRTAIHEIFLRMQQLNKETRYSIWNALKAAGKLTEY